MNSDSELAPLVLALRTWLEAHGVGESISGLAAGGMMVSVALLLGALLQAIAHRVIRRYIGAWVEKTSSGFDDLLYQRRVFSRLSRVLPGALVFLSAPLALPAHTTAQAVVERAALVYVVVVIAGTAKAFLDAVEEHYRRLPNIGVPIKGYVQMASLILALGAGVLTLAIVLDQSPLYFLSSLGALSAVLLLVFKDPLLGLVASVQLAANDMVRLGDWIEVPKYGADGEVVDITLTTVKVRNWDKTMSLLPAYALVSDAFRNWRAMSEAGGRRIKRSIPVDMNSVRRCTDADLERFKQVALLHDYVEEKATEIREHNASVGVSGQDPINGRSLTNLGVFRVYVEAYLRQESRVRKDFTFMVRQLEPSPQGLPIEIYVFTTTTEWARYEAIQADLFDHLLAVSRFFGLRILQHAGGEDLREVARAIEKATPSSLASPAG